MKQDLAAASSRAEKLLADVLAGKSEKHFVDGATGLLGDSPGAAIILLWDAGRMQLASHPAVARTVAYGAAASVEAPECTVPPLLHLTAPPFTQDPAALINTLAALKRMFSANEEAIGSFAPGLARFLVHCLDAAPLVQDSAIGFLAEVLDRYESVFTQAQALLLLNGLNGIAREAEHAFADDLAFVREELGGAKAKIDARASTWLSAMAERLDETAAGTMPASVGKAFARAAEFVRSRLLLLETAAAARRTGLPVHFIRIARESASELPLSIVAAVSDAWQEVVQACAQAMGGVPNVFALEAARGSIVIRVAIDHENAEPALDTVRRLASADEETELVGVLKDAEIPATRYRDLLRPLVDANASLDVGAYSPTTDAFSVPLVISSDEARTRTAILRHVTAARLMSDEVPQADDIERVFALLELVASEKDLTPDALGVTTTRQVNYYKHAARVLGFIGEYGRPDPAGEQVVRLDAGQRLAFTCVRFESSRCGNAWVRWANASSLIGVAAESAEQFLADAVVDLSPATIHRRARTLVAWHKLLVPYHYAAQGSGD